jgi:hypothetical protein
MFDVHLFHLTGACRKFRRPEFPGKQVTEMPVQQPGEFREGLFIWLKAVRYIDGPFDAVCVKMDDFAVDPHKRFSCSGRGRSTIVTECCS